MQFWMKKFLGFNKSKFGLDGLGMCLVSLRLMAVVGILTAAGCSSNPAIYPEVADVVGVVTLDGQPLEGATITFAPEAGRASSGVTDSTGRYSLNYTGSIRGAMLGAHRVMIKKMVQDKAATPSKAEQLMDKATNLMLQDAGLPLTTAANDKESEPLKPIMINVVAAQYSGPESILTAEVEPYKNEIDFDLTQE